MNISDPLKLDLASMCVNSDVWHTVTQAEAGNPQLIASKYYKNVEYFDAVLYHNGIPHPSDMITGTVLNIPKIVSAATQTKEYTV